MIELVKKNKTQRVQQILIRLPFKEMKALPPIGKIKQLRKDENNSYQFEIEFEKWTMPALEPGRIKCPRYDFF